MQNYEKKQSEAVNGLYKAAFKLKQKLADLLIKIDTQGESCMWPKYLATIALCASELSEIRKVADSDRFALSQGFVITPIMLNPEPDAQLARTTEDRLSVINHESVPQYLRTKLDPVVEQQCQAQQQRALTTHTPEQIMKMITVANKYIDNSLKEVNQLKSEIENDFNAGDNILSQPSGSSGRGGDQSRSSGSSSSRSAAASSTSNPNADDILHDLVTAVMVGKGLKTK